MNRWIGQRSTMTADEHMKYIIASTEFTTAHQIALQTRDRRVVQWHQARLSEFSFANQQAIFRDVCKSPVPAPQKHAARWRPAARSAWCTVVGALIAPHEDGKSTGGFEKATDFVGRINVRHAPCLAGNPK